MPTERPAQRIHDILANIASIEDYTDGLSEKSFSNNRMVVDAVERCLERIAEAARKLGDQFDTAVSNEIDLHAIRPIRQCDFGTITTQWILKFSGMSLRSSCQN